jgi:adenylate cyclase
LACTLCAHLKIAYKLRVVDSPGDNLLAEFVSVVDTVQYSEAVQKEIKACNDEWPENRMMRFRIVINLGDVIQEEDRIKKALRRKQSPGPKPVKKSATI